MILSIQFVLEIKDCDLGLKYVNRCTGMYKWFSFNWIAVCWRLWKLLFCIKVVDAPAGNSLLISAFFLTFMSYSYEYRIIQIVVASDSKNMNYDDYFTSSKQACFWLNFFFGVLAWIINKGALSWFFISFLCSWSSAHQSMKCWQIQNLIGKTNHWFKFGENFLRMEKCLSNWNPMTWLTI